MFEPSALKVEQIVLIGDGVGRIARLIAAWFLMRACEIVVPSGVRIRQGGAEGLVTRILTKRKLDLLIDLTLASSGTRFGARVIEPSAPIMSRTMKSCWLVSGGSSVPQFRPDRSRPTRPNAM